MAPETAANWRLPDCHCMTPVYSSHRHVKSPMGTVNLCRGLFRKYSIRRPGFPGAAGMRIAGS